MCVCITSWRPRFCLSSSETLSSDSSWLLCRICSLSLNPWFCFLLFKSEPPMSYPTFPVHIYTHIQVWTGITPHMHNHTPTYSFNEEPVLLLTTTSVLSVLPFFPTLSQLSDHFLLAWAGRSQANWKRFTLRPQCFCLYSIFKTDLY